MSYRCCLILVIVLLLLPGVSAAGDPHLAWYKSLGSYGADWASAVGTDAAGNVYVAGDFMDTVDFGGGPLVAVGSDLFLAKYSPTGAHLWSKRIGADGYESCESMSVDDAGSLSITGRYSSPIDFGGGPLPVNGGTDIFVAHFDPNGNHVWSVGLGSDASDYAAGVQLDRHGETIITATFAGVIQVGSQIYTNVGSDDLLVVKFNRQGAPQWSHAYGNPFRVDPAGLAIDSEDNVILASSAADPMDYGGGTLYPRGYMDIDLVKLDASGAHVWSERWGGTDNDFVMGVAVDALDNILLTGRFAGTTNLGGSDLDSRGWNDAFVAKFDAAGAHLWSASHGSAFSDQGIQITAGESGEVYVIGNCEDSADFGGGPLPHSAETDWIVASYDPDGSHRWSRSFGGAARDTPSGLCTDRWGNVLVAGSYEMTVDLGSGAITTAGMYDGLLARFCQAPDIASVRDVPGDQGLVVNLAWDACSADNSADRAISHYTVWRAIDAAAARELLDRGANWLETNPGAGGRDSTVLRADAGNYWFATASVEARGLSGYSAPVPTLFDSTGVSTELHYFQVTAHTEDPWIFYASAPDSGYSVDNLAPETPAGLMVAYGPTNVLSWEASSAPDFAWFNIYRSTSGATPRTAPVLVHQTAELGWVDPGGSWGVEYLLAVVDDAGNESELATPVSVTAANDAPVTRVTRLLGSSPNPFNPRTTISYSLATSGDTELVVYDLAGRRVKTLVSGYVEAGQHDTQWDGCDEHGRRVASGVYLCRLVAGDFTETNGVTLLK